MPALIQPADLAPFATIAPERAAAMIEDVTASAARVAPCLRDADLAPELVAAARAILRGAVLRWNEAVSGVTTTATAGPFNVSTQPTTQPAQRRGLLWPSEIDELQAICGQHTPSAATSRAYGVNTAAGTLGRLTHADDCTATFGAPRCSCGLSLTLGRWAA